MDSWFWMLVASIAALLAVAVRAIARSGPPEGRFLLFSAALLGAVGLGSLAWQQSGASAAAGAVARGGWISAVLLGPVWIACGTRFGHEKRSASRTDLAALALASVIAPLLLAYSAMRGGPNWNDGGSEGWVLALETGPARAMTGFLLLAGAFGVVRHQGLREGARRVGLDRLGLAALGLLAVSLGLFLFSSQALLYGTASLRMLAAASLAVLPGSLALLPVLGSRNPEECVLPSAARPGASSMVLLGLGLFLIALAVFAQVIHRLLPEGGLIWFHWGGGILLLILGSLWMVPGLRELARRYFEPAVLAKGDPRWEWARVNRALAQVETLEELARRVNALTEDVLHGARSVLWLRDADGSGILRAVGGSTVPGLHPTNPLRAAGRGEASRGGDGDEPEVIDLSRPPTRVRQLPLYVENLDLIDTLGLRVFVPLRIGAEELGMLGLDLRSRVIGPEAKGFLQNLGAQLANLLWSMKTAEPRAARERGDGWAGSSGDGLQAIGRRGAEAP